MSVSKPRAYAAYARDVAAGAANSGSAADSRRLRAGVAVRLRLAVRFGELAQQLVAPIVQASEPPFLPLGERVRREDGKADRVVEVTNHGARELVGVDLAPAYRLGGRRSRQAARVGAGVGDLQVVVVPLLADAQDLLDLRLRLQHEVLGGATPDDQDATLAAMRLRVEHDCRRLVHVGARIEAQPGAGERLLGDVHADRRVPGRRRVDRHATLMGDPEQRFARQAQRLLPLEDVSTQEVEGAGPVAQIVARG